jgi:hypothetical protein
MLRSINSLCKYRIETLDTFIGGVYDFLFDNSSWEVKYIVVEIRTWKRQRYVILTTDDVAHMDIDKGAIVTNLTREEIYGKPELRERLPVDLRYQTKLHERIDLPDYWPAYGYYRIPPHGSLSEVTKEVGVEVLQEGDTHLLSSRQIIGYKVSAINGTAGQVHDFIVDDERWSVIEVAVDVNKWLAANKVTIPPTFITEIRWAEETIFLDMSKQSLEESPDYDISEAVNSKQVCEVKLYDYAGRQR